jgi:hypothetical protein
MQEFVYKKAGEFTIKHAEQIANVFIENNFRN